MTPADVLRVAAEAGVDPRTVRRVVLEGVRPRSRTTAAALVNALLVHGFVSEADAITSRVETPKP